MIIGLSGYARSGKDTIAAHLVEKYGFKRLAFADPMREALYRLNPKIELEGTPGVAMRQAVDSLGWDAVKVMSPDARELLQRFGTEVVREMFGKDFWVDYTLNLAKNYDKVVISDVRFKNEAYAIEGVGGVLWRVQREGTEAVNSHASEHDLDDYDFDLTFNNASTIESLYKTVEFIMDGGVDE